MQLRSAQPSAVDDVHHTIRKFIAEHPHGQHLSRETTGYVAGPVDSHLTRRGGEHETHCISAESSRQQSVFLARNPADLDEHGSDASGS